MIDTANEQLTEVDALKALTPEAFAQLGAPGLVYVRPVEKDGTTLFAVYAADGSPIGFFEARDQAIGTALQNDLTPLSVH